MPQQTVINILRTQFRVLETTIPGYFKNTNAYTYYTRGKEFYLYNYDSTSGYQSNLKYISENQATLVMEGEIIVLPAGAWQKPQAGMDVGDRIRVEVNESARTVTVTNLTKNTYAKGTLVSELLRRTTITVDEQPPADTTPPVVTIDLPADSARVSLPVTRTITGTVSDDVKAAKVEVKLNGLELPVTGLQTWSASVTIFEAGEHIVTAKAFDEAGNASAEVKRTLTLTEIKEYREDWS